MRRGAFTLVEILVTLSVASLLLTAVYGAFLGSLSAKRICEEATRTHRLGQGILTLLRRDLSGAMRMEEGEISMQGTSEAGAGGSADRVEFVTTSDARRALQGKGADHCEVGYRAEPDPDAPGMLRLVRREAHGIQGSLFEGGALEVLAEGVSSFQLEYLGDGADWTSEWQAEDLPRAARALLVLREKNADGAWGRERSFRALIVLPSGGS